MISTLLLGEKFGEIVVAGPQARSVRLQRSITCRDGCSSFTRSMK